MQVLPLSNNDAFNLLKKDIFATFNCHRIGIIQSFDPETQTASVSLVDKIVRIFNDPTSSTNPQSTYEYVDFPILNDCPVIVNTGQNGGITIPIVQGDTCIVHFNDRDIDKWWVSGQIQAPNTPRLHDFSDAIVEIGPKCKLNFLQNYNNIATEIYYGINEKTSLVSLSADSNISSYKNKAKVILNDTQSKIQYTADADILLNATNIKIAYKDAQIVLNDTASEMTYQDTKISLDAKVGISNASQDFKTLIDNLFTINDTLLTTLIGLTVIDPISGPLPLSPGVISSLNSIKTNMTSLKGNFDSLLK